MAENYAQEYTQEVIPAVGVNIAAEATGKEKPNSFEEITKNAHEAGVTGAVVSAILGTAGQGVNIAYDSLMSTTVKQTAAMSVEEANKVIANVVNSPEFEAEGQAYMIAAQQSASDVVATENRTEGDIVSAEEVKTLQSAFEERVSLNNAKEESRIIDLNDKNVQSVKRKSLR